MVELEVTRTSEVSVTRLEEIRSLLVAAFGGDFSNDDWEHALGGWHVMAFDVDLVAHAAVVPRTLLVGEVEMRTGYVEGVATASARRRQGHGAQIMHRVGRLLRTDYHLGALSTSATAFYERAGWDRWQGPTFVRHGEELVRTVEEDDGIMVLRFGANRELDLGARICCDSRAGDDW